MLRSLEIRDMLLIDRLDLRFGPGLNVLTGETGAGKSILLDCLGFVLGWRGRADLVRQGAPQGEGADTLTLGPRITSLPLREARELFEREYLLNQINRFGGNISRTAQFVGMERSALHRKLKSLGVVGGMRNEEEMLAGK